MTDDLVEPSKYSLRENANGTFTLMRFGEPKGVPNNAELEFWLRAQDAEARCKRMKAVVEAARKANTALNDLISESEGVVGLHLNGDTAPWHSLLFGGAYQEWLLPFEDLSESLDALAAEGEKG